MFVKNQTESVLKAVVDCFNGNNRADNYIDLIETILKSFKIMGCRMSLKLPTLYTYLDENKSECLLRGTGRTFSLSFSLETVSMCGEFFFEFHISVN